jgi:hypothetical protein
MSTPGGIGSCVVESITVSTLPITVQESATTVSDFFWAGSPKCYLLFFVTGVVICVTLLSAAFDASSNQLLPF